MTELLAADLDSTAHPRCPRCGADNPGERCQACGLEQGTHPGAVYPGDQSEQGLPPEAEQEPGVPTAHQDLQPHAGMGMPPGRRRNAKAQWSMILGFFGLFTAIPAVVAVVVGIFAQLDLRADPQQEGRVASLVGIGLGLVGMALWIYLLVTF